MNEEQLISALTNTPESAFRTLVDKYQEKVLNTCLGFVPHLQDAEDLCQEVFVEVYRSVSRFEGKSTLSTWIYRISVNKCLEFIRARKRKKRSFFFKSLIGLNEAAERLDTGRFDHPGVLLEDKERTRILFGAIHALPEKQQIAFTLHKVEGMPYQEIAQVMETSLSSVESLMFRAKKNLQKKLTSYYKMEGI